MGRSWNHRGLLLLNKPHHNEVTSGLIESYPEEAIHIFTNIYIYITVTQFYKLTVAE